MHKHGYLPNLTNDAWEASDPIVPESWFMSLIGLGDVLSRADRQGSAGKWVINLVIHNLHNDNK